MSYNRKVLIKSSKKVNLLHCLHVISYFFFQFYHIDYGKTSMSTEPSMIRFNKYLATVFFCRKPYCAAIVMHLEGLCTKPNLVQWLSVINGWFFYTPNEKEREKTCTVVSIMIALAHRIAHSPHLKGVRSEPYLVQWLSVINGLASQP